MDTLRSIAEGMEHQGHYFEPSVDEGNAVERQGSCLKCRLLALCEEADKMDLVQKWRQCGCKKCQERADELATWLASRQDREGATMAENEPSKESLRKVADDLTERIVKECLKVYGNAIAGCFANTTCSQIIEDAMRQQNAALVSALRELERKWREPRYAYRSAPLNPLLHGYDHILSDSQAEKYHVADMLKCADDLKSVLDRYAPAEAEAKEKP